jgi:hypothetical protein
MTDPNPHGDDTGHAEPGNPLSPLIAMAVQLHELFQALVHAGFTETQAMYMVASQVCGGPKG